MSELTGKAKELAEYMSQISQDSYAAQWMCGLELDLWAAVVSGPCSYGWSQITEENIAHMKKLSDEIEGWIYFDEQLGEVFMPLKEWEIEYQIHYIPVPTK